MSIVLSIDASHSMDGSKIHTARKLVSTIFESVKSIDNVDVKANVWGGDIRGKTGMTEINSAGDIKFINTHNDYFSTPIHMALEHSGTMLKHMKGSKKMMIVITDGHPNHYNNGFHLTWHTYSISCKNGSDGWISATMALPQVVRTSNLVCTDQTPYGCPITGPAAAPPLTRRAIPPL